MNPSSFPLLQGDPPMTKRRKGQSTAGIAALGALVLLIPGTPLYLPTFFSASGQYRGHSSRYWLRALNDPDASTRREATRAVEALGPEAGAEAVPALATILVEDAEPRSWADSSWSASYTRPTASAHRHPPGSIAAWPTPPSWTA
jgi:hypothetical protein